MNKNYLNKFFVKSLVKPLALAVTLLVVSSAWANDCGWSDLTSQEQSDLMANKTIMRHSMDADGVRSHIDQWSFSKNSSLIESVANFWDESNTNSGGVANVSLADGYVITDNPIVYNVVPNSGNPFGKLYQPFSFSSQVKEDGDGYNVQMNYLSSPGLIKHVFNDICLTNVKGEVLIRFLSTVTDNPNLPINGSVFGWITRKFLWKKVFSDAVERASRQGSPDKVDNLMRALENQQQ